MRACRVLRAISPTANLSQHCPRTPSIVPKCRQPNIALRQSVTLPHNLPLSQLNSNRTFTMATNGATTSSPHQTLEQVTQKLSEFGISSIPQFPNAYPALNPVDIYRAHITELLAPITGADPKVIYQAIQWTLTLDKGDLVLPVPALRLKGKKPGEVAKQIIENVGFVNPSLKS